MIPIKTADEIKMMEQACRISAGALAAGGKMVRPGVTTQEIDNVIHEYIVSHDAKPSFLGYNGFTGSACISVNDTVIHGIPSASIVVQEGDIVSIDTGAYYNGFHGDNAFTFACGPISDEAKKLCDFTKQSLFNAIEMVKPGNRLGDIGHAVQSTVEPQGYSIVRAFVGHGVGRELHEAPEVPNYGKAGYGRRLAAGMTLAIEPMVNQKGADIYIKDDNWTVKTTDGALSAHYEHTVLVTDDGAKILTWENSLWGS